MATATVSTLAALDTLLTSWATGGGSTITEESVVTLDDGAYTTGLNIDNLSFPYRVWVQGRAPSTNGASPVSVSSGNWYFRNTTNLGIRLIDFSIGGDAIFCGGSTNLWMDRCKLQGGDVANPATTSYPHGSSFLTASGTTMNGLKVTNCLLGRANSTVLVLLANGANQEITGNVFLDTGSDFIRLASIYTGSSKIDDNWFGKRMNPGTGAHSDCIQTYPSTTSFTGSISGNVMWRGLMQRDSAINLQCVFIADGGSVTGTIEQNILVTDSVHAISLYTSGGTSVDNNGVFVVTPGNAYQPRIYVTGGDTGTRNISFTNNSSVGLDGTNLTVAPGTAPAHANILTYYAEAPDPTGNIGQLTPVESSGTHWNDSTPYGPATRLQEIIVSGLHPGNVGWPVAEEWTDLWNNGAQDGTVISSNYSGSYNADGTNVTVPQAPTINGVPTISGLENVGQTLTATFAPVTGSPVPTRTWQWYNVPDGIIAGATSSTYTLQSTDLGDVVYVIQTEDNDEEPNATAQSANTGTIGAELATPAISTLSPADNATGVAITASLIITFTVNVQFGPSGTITLWRAGAARETWLVQNDPNNAHSLSIDGAALTITTQFDMRDDADYSIHIDAGAIQSTEGVAFPGISDDTTWNFSTSSAAPSSADTAFGLGSAALLLNGGTLII